MKFNESELNAAYFNEVCPPDASFVARAAVAFCFTDRAEISQEVNLNAVQTAVDSPRLVAEVATV